MTCRCDRPARGRDLLVPLAGLFAAMDAALQRVSKARVEEMRREGVKRRRRARGGGRRTAARHVALLLLLRIVCETGRRGAGDALLLRPVGQRLADGR